MDSIISALWSWKVSEKNRISLLSPIFSLDTDFFCGLEQIISSSYVLAYQLYKIFECMFLQNALKQWGESLEVL